jgi:hypothetical protein
MKTLRIIALLLTALVLSPTVFAQMEHWNKVSTLARDARIAVRTGRHFHEMCFFQYATDDRLSCKRVLRGLRSVLLSPDETFARDQIREVRLEHGDTVNAATGAAIGGGIGATLGAAQSSGSLTRGGGALLLGTGGAIMGGFRPRLSRPARKSDLPALISSLEQVTPLTKGY